MIQIRDIPDGSIVWKGNGILGVKEFTLNTKYYNNYCTKIRGNNKDYELVKED